MAVLGRRARGLEAFALQHGLLVGRHAVVQLLGLRQLFGLHRQLVGRILGVLRKLRLGVLDRRLGLPLLARLLLDARIGVEPRQPGLAQRLAEIGRARRHHAEAGRQQRALDLGREPEQAALSGLRIRRAGAGAERRIEFRHRRAGIVGHHIGADIARRAAQPGLRGARPRGRAARDHRRQRPDLAQPGRGRPFARQRQFRQVAGRRAVAGVIVRRAGPIVLQRIEAGRVGRRRRQRETVVERIRHHRTGAEAGETYRAALVVMAAQVDAVVGRQVDAAAAPRRGREVAEARHVGRAEAAEPGVGRQIRIIRGAGVAETAQQVLGALHGGLVGAQVAEPGLRVRLRRAGRLGRAGAAGDVQGRHVAAGVPVGRARDPAAEVEPLDAAAALGEGAERRNAEARHLAPRVGRRRRGGRGAAHLRPHPGVDAGEPLGGLERVGLLAQKLLELGRVARLLGLLLERAGADLGARPGERRLLARHPEIAERIGGVAVLLLLGERHLLGVLESALVEPGDDRRLRERLLARQVGLRHPDPVAAERALRRRVADQRALLLGVLVVELGLRRLHHLLGIGALVAGNLARRDRRRRLLGKSRRLS